MADNMCSDNRFEVIAKAKEKLIGATNIEDCPKEMEVLDNILFRMWQCGFLDGNWHTGTPTEEVWYVCKMKGADLYETQYFTGVNWNEEIIEKWQKIEETE